MADLTPMEPLEGQQPLALGGVTLRALPLGRITSVAPLAGQGAAVARALAPLGLSFPPPGRLVAQGEARIAWAGLSLDGPGAAEVLARLVPLDLRREAMPGGSALRTPLNHMAAILLREGAERFTILVFRSMARTAWHELEAAMEAVAARQRIAR